MPYLDTIKSAVLLWLILAAFITAGYEPIPLRWAAVKGLVLSAVTLVSVVPLWWVTARLAWPARLTARFCGLHAVLAMGYGLIWAVLDLAQASLLAGESRFHFFGPLLVAYGGGIYGMAASFCYALRAHQRARAQELAATRLQAAAAQARLEALRARLNPHFLYNSLHALAALVRVEPAAAEPAFERLGSLLRYVLDETGEEVSLDEEWAFVRNYLELERLRLGDRLRVESQLDPDARPWLIPPLTVQPLVENAVRHAVAPRTDGGTVGIRAQVADGGLRITVWDDGPGATLDALRNGRGLGLRAVRERVEGVTANGVRGELHLETRPGAGLAATIFLPEVA
jgi:signal transduction histidine kinase